MAIATGAAAFVPWWKEPTKDQWIAWWAAWLGWTLDAFDFTVFLLIMVPISQEFGVPLVAVTAVFTVTLWLRLVGATASGWLADRVGRKIPLMISILWFSICNFIAGFSPNFAFLFFFRAMLGIGMGAEWPAGASLAMESWPVRSRGFMSGILQGSWGLGFLLSSAIYGLFYSYIGWRGMLWIGILPALAVIWVRKYVKEPEVWLENRRKQRAREARDALAAVRHLQAGPDRQHADSLLVDGELYDHILLDLGVVRDTPAEGPRHGAGDGRCAACARQSDRIPRHGVLGLGRRCARPPLVDDHPGGDRPARDTDLSADQRSHLDYRRLPAPVGIRRRDVQPDAELPDRALPYRGEGNGERLLLSSGSDLRRIRGTGSDLFRRQL